MLGALNLSSARQLAPAGNVPHVLLHGLQQLTKAACLQVMLLPTKEQVEARVRERAQQGCHFMAPSLLADQLATLELPPTPTDFFHCLPGALPCQGARHACHLSAQLLLRKGSIQMRPAGKGAVLALVVHW